MKMNPRFFRRSAISIGAVLVLAACSAPGSKSSDDSEPSDETPATSTTIDAPITPEEVAELGDITLTVWADQGEQEFMDVLLPEFEDKYANVTVDISYKSFNDLTATVLNAMNSDDAPDVTQGNQGWATDGALVKAGLLRNLDDVVAAYGYDDAVGNAITQLQWSEDGANFGSGSTYGMSPDNQMVGIFVNQDKLADLGAEIPTNLDEMEAILEQAADGGDTPIILGNSDKAGAMQALSLVQGALTPAEDTRDWITGADGASFDVDTNVEALDRFSNWVDSGYVSSGYDGLSPDDAAAEFASGNGVFFIGGNWYASTIESGDTYTFIPGFAAGGHASSGSFGMPWHVSSKTDNELAALAFVGMINSADTAATLVDVQRVPVFSVTDIAEGSMMAALVEASEAQLGEDGALYWYDWATDTMFDTFSGALQERLADKIDSSEFVDRVQADWDAFQN